MAETDTSPDWPAHDPSDQLRHDLKTPLVAIHGRAQLLARAVRCSRSLSDTERETFLDGLTAIEGAVREMVTLIDDIGREGRG